MAIIWQMSRLDACITESTGRMVSDAGKVVVVVLEAGHVAHVGLRRRDRALLCGLLDR